MNSVAANPNKYFLIRLMRALGFRLVFPIGTLPIPYHPLLAFILPMLPLVWVLATMPDVTGITIRDPQWPMFLITGALLGVPLSIPVVAWALMVFRGPLVQALFFLFGMIMVVIDWYYGRASTFWLVLPTSYVLLWVGQLVLGQARRRALVGERNSFIPMTAVDRVVVLDPFERQTAIGLIQTGRARIVYATYGGSLARGSYFERISDAEVNSIKGAANGKPPRFWLIHEDKDVIILERPGDAPTGEVLHISREGKQSWAGVPSPDLVIWTIRTSTEMRRLPAGKFAHAGPLPLATLFHWTALVGQSQWVVGFLPRNKALGDGRSGGAGDLLEPAEFSAPRGVRQHITDALDEATRAVREKAEQERAKARAWRRKANTNPPVRLVLSADGTRTQARSPERTDRKAFWHAVITEPARWVEHSVIFNEMVDEAQQASREDLCRTLDWFEAAIQQDQRKAAAAAAQYLAEMPQQMLASEYQRLESIFNSRTVGMVWQITPDLDPKPLPPRIPRWQDEAGFGMIRQVPDLYIKLAELGPHMGAIVAGIAKEAIEYGIALPPALAEMASREK
jgi:hypothetical protein